MTLPDIMNLKEIGLRLAQSVESYHKRAFVTKLSLGKEPRIKVLIGFRGVGKTTALLQLMKEDKCIYFSLDHPQILGNKLYDLGKMCINAGYKRLLIDEIHHYKDWKIDTKALYDEFPDAELIVSGSAPLAFEPERRYEIIAVNPLSLKELLELEGKKIEDPQTAWKDINRTVAFLARHHWLYEYFQRYLVGGGFPLYFAYGDKTLSALYNSIRKSLWEDAPFFGKIHGEDCIILEKLLLSLATAEAGELSIHSLTKHLGIKKHKGYECITLLEKMKIVRLIRPYGRGPKLVRGDPKLIFYHPNLRSAICKALEMTPSVGALREELAVFSFSERGWHVAAIKGQKKNPDYIIRKGNEEYIVEIGGPSKTARQLKGFAKKTLVIDERQIITLSLF